MKKKFNPMDMKPVRFSKSAEKKMIPYDGAEFFSDPKQVLLFLADALADGDEEAFFDIIRIHLKYVNKEELSRNSKIPIATIRRIAAGSSFNIHMLFRLTEALKKAS